MSEEIDLATPEVDVDAVVETSSDGVTPSEEAKPEEPYLSVNERTVYKTREDAVRGYNEAASRIAQLSGWEKQAKQYGLSDPKQLDAVATELLALRKEKADAAAKLNAAPAKSDPADPKAKEAQQVKDYLKANGFISKEDQEAVLKELRDQIAEMKQSGTRSEEVRFQNQETEARDNLKDWLSTSGVKDDVNGTKAQVVGTLIKDWINNDDERIERWTRGGVSAKTLVKEGYDFALKALDWKGTPVADTTGKPTDATYAANKAKALAANKKLPAPGTAKADGSKPAPKKGGAINPAMHDKAWEMFQKLNDGK